MPGAQYLSFGFTCDQPELERALSLVARAVGRVEPGRVALAGVLIDACGDRATITASDLVVSISTSVRIREADGGIVLLPGRLLHAIVSVLDAAPVTIAVEGGHAHISAGTSEFRIRTMRHEDYPESPHGEPWDYESDVACDGVALTGSLARVLRSTSRDPNKPVLSGVLMEADGDALKLVSTDTYRLAVCCVKGHSDLLGGRSRVILPAAAAAAFRRLFGSAEMVRVRMAQRFVQVEGDDRLLTGRLVAGQYPDYAAVVPNSAVPVATALRVRLALGLRRVRLLTLDEALVTLSLSRGTLGLEACNSEIGSASDAMPAAYAGARAEGAFHPEHLSDGVEVTPGESVDLAFHGPRGPCVMRSGEDDGFLYLLMPQAVG